MKFVELASDIMGVIKKIIDVSGIIETTISTSLSIGIENAFDNLKSSIEQIILKTSFIIISAFLIIWGGASILDNFVPYRGLGFVIVGITVGVLAWIVLRVHEKK
ncbi:MAG: hypothetical protein WCW13_04160 [archaeon]|jgi:hypothetical protein